MGRFMEQFIGRFLGQLWAIFVATFWPTVVAIFLTLFLKKFGLMVWVILQVNFFGEFTSFRIEVALILFAIVFGQF